VPKVLRAQRGQTATEYLGLLLVVSMIIAAIASTSLPANMRRELARQICRIANDAADCPPSRAQLQRRAEARERRAARRDRDGDGVPDRLERRYGTNPRSSDSDGDGIGDAAEIRRAVADGWEPVVETGQPIAAITQPYGDDCILLVQVAAAGGTGKPEAPTRRGLGRAESGSRALVVGRPQGDERFSVRFTLGEAQRLDFSGGATGPGGHLFMEFEPDSPPGTSTPWLTLTAQGGTEGPGCLTRPAESAPAIVVKALRLMAQGASVRYTQ
jgi:hypothetical protein